MVVSSTSAISILRDQSVVSVGHRATAGSRLLGSLVREETAWRCLFLQVVPPNEQDLRNALLQELRVVEEVAANLVGLPRHLLHGAVPPEPFQGADPVEDVQDAPVALVVLPLVLLEVFAEVVDVGNVQAIDLVAVSRRAVGVLQDAQNDRERLGIDSAG